MRFRTFLLALILLLLSGSLLRAVWRAVPSGRTAQREGTYRVRTPAQARASELALQKARVKLWTGWVYQTNQDRERARQSYEEAIRMAGESADESAVARQLIEQLDAPAAAAPAPIPAGEPAAGPSPAETQAPLAPPPLLGALQPSPQEKQAPPQEAAAVKLPKEPMSFLEAAIPMFVELTTRRLASYVRGAGETEVVRSCSQEELQQIVTEAVRSRLRDRAREVQVEIHPDGLLGSAVLLAGPVPVHLSCRSGVTVVGGRLHLAIRELKVEGLGVPAAVNALLQKRINHLIDQRRYSVRFRQLQLYEGSLFMSAELTDMAREITDD